MNLLIETLNKIVASAPEINVVKGRKSYALDSADLPVDVGITYVQTKLNELRAATKPAKKA